MNTAMKQFLFCAVLGGLMFTSCGQSTQKGAQPQSATDSMAAVIQAGIQKPEGVKMLLRHHRKFDAKQVQEWLAQIPEALRDPAVADLSMYYQVMELTDQGKRYLDFSMQTPEGKEKKLSEFVSQHPYTLLDFWVASGDEQQQVMPRLAKLYQQYHGKGLEIVGVSLDTDEALWKKAIREQKLTWPQLSDLKGVQGLAFRQYADLGSGTSFLIDQQGNIVGKFQQIEELEARLKELIKE